MLILLPPSEGKTPPRDGPAVDLDSMTHPALTAMRLRVGKALVAVSGQRNALTALGVGPSLAGEVVGNRSLWTAPAAAAAHVYSGVLYDAAGMAAWSPDQLSRAAQRVRIVSALWGLVSPADRIPAYRLSMSTSLGRIGPLAAAWRPHLAAELDRLTAQKLVVDCRSAAYSAAWKAPSSAIAIRVEQRRDDRRIVVSHMAKHARGVLAGALAAAPAPPTTPAELADLARELPGTADVELGDGGLTLITESTSSLSSPTH